GNIWKFPYIAGENGGGAFVLVYLICIAVVGVPIMMGEVLIGRRGRSSPINTMRSLTLEAQASPLWKYVGWMGAIAGLLILSYYSVIAGWAIIYIYRLGSGQFEGADAATVEQSFSGLLADPVMLTALHTMFMLMTMVVVARGVNKGLEAAIRVLMPMLFVLLIILLGYSFSSGSFEEGARFLFDFNFDKLKPESILIALGHAFFTLSLGMGAIMVYGAYMPKKASIGSTILIVAGMDTLVALAAGLAIFPIVFANNMEPGAGPGLLFVTLPIAFGQMPGGIIFGTLFFLLVTFAAWSSSISLIEPMVAWVVEKGVMTRNKASLALGILTWALGMGTVVSFNVAEDVHIFMGKNIFDSLDYLTANIMLPLGGLLVAIFAGWTMKRTIVEKELNMSSYALYALWTITIRLVSPAAVIIVMAWTLFQEQIKAILGW
ncbi:MAG: sodium-dependent transporter, partial [Gammaproteobacteria bacterium]|nr:sodium-dependent transporter [Gammaproteobacteria bacterium]